MGFMDWIGPALTPISQGVAGYQQGVAQQQKQAQSDQMQMIELLRQKNLDADRQAQQAIENQWKQKEMSNLDSEIDARKQAAAKDALTNQRAHQGLFKAGVISDPYDNTMDYTKPWTDYNAEKLNKANADRDNNQYRAMMLNAYGTDPDAGPRIKQLIASEDPKNPLKWKDLWTQQQAEESGARSDARQTRSLDAASARQTAAITAGITAAQQRVADRPEPGAADRVKQATALANFKGSLERYATALDGTGTAIMPGPQQAALSAARTDVLDQLNTLNQMGALRSFELEQYKSMLVDPTSAMERVKSYGSGANQVARAKAGVKLLRDKLKDSETNFQDRGGYAPAGYPSLQGPNGMLAPRDGTTVPTRKTARPENVYGIEMPP